MRYLSAFLIVVALSSACLGQSRRPVVFTDSASVAYADSQVVFETTMGKIVLNLLPEVAPMHVASFVKLVNQGFYDSLTIHRVIKDVLIQGGSPDGTPTGKGPWTVPAEFSDVPHVDGTLAMARPADPNGASCQFYFTLRRVAMYDGSYTVFGKVADDSSLAVVHAISAVKSTGKQRPPQPSDKPLEPVVILHAYVQPREMPSAEKKD